MSAGLPGVGLSGVFFIVSALLMVPLEIARTIRGRSSLARWVRVLRHLAIAVAMIVCVELVYAAARWALAQLRSAPRHPHGMQAAATHAGFHILPWAPVLATLAVIAVLLALAKAAQLLARWRKSRALAMIQRCSATSSRLSTRVPRRASPSPAPSSEA